MTNITIKASTPIEELREAGIVPDWIAEDCEEHGMYESENILSEWDIVRGCTDLSDSHGFLSAVFGRLQEKVY